MAIDFSTREGRRAQGKLIQLAAEEMGFSLEALAREIGCSRALIYQYVSGATLAQPDRIQQIAERTGKPLIFFYGADSAPEGLQDRIATLTTLLAAQSSSPDWNGAISTCEQLLALTHQAGDTRAEALLRLRLTGILLQQGDADRAMSVLDQTWPILRSQQMTAQLLTADQHRGHALLALGRADEAEACFARVAAADSWTARWQGLVSLAAVDEYRGRYHDAITRLDDAGRLAELATDIHAARTLQMYVAGNLANVHLACGDIAEATTHALRAQEIAMHLANQDQYLESLLTLGVCQRWQGDLPQSRVTLESAARWTRLLHDKGREAQALAELAQTLVETGRYDDARSHGKNALQLAIATSTRRAELRAQLALAQGYGRAGMAQDACYHAAQALEISRHLGQRYAYAEALLIHGETQRAIGSKADAKREFTEAGQLADELGARILAVQTQIALAGLGEPVEITALQRATDALHLPLLTWATLSACGQAAQVLQEISDAKAYYRDAIRQLTTLRKRLAADAEYGDAYLEYRAAWTPYRRLAALLRAQGDATGAADIIAEAAWPPLSRAEEEASCVS